MSFNKEVSILVDVTYSEGDGEEVSSSIQRCMSREEAVGLALKSWWFIHPDSVIIKIESEVAW